MSPEEIKAEYASDIDIPLGSVVIYRGSIDYMRDRAFVVIEGNGYGNPGSISLQLMTVHDEGRKFGETSGTLWNVRPKSVELVVLPS